MKRNPVKKQAKVVEMKGGDMADVLKSHEPVLGKLIADMDARKRRVTVETDAAVPGRATVSAEPGLGPAEFAKIAKALEDEKPAATREDPWAHRSMMMRCRTCMWFASKGGTKLGRCRRRAPDSSGYGWSPVFESDWCGDHKLDETKLP